MTSLFVNLNTFNFNYKIFKLMYYEYIKLHEFDSVSNILPHLLVFLKNQKNQKN